MLKRHDYGYAIDAKTITAHRLECDVPHHACADQRRRSLRRGTEGAVERGSIGERPQAASRQ
jgi:hypothetical protein